jgi:hypothetical protein
MLEQRMPRIFFQAMEGAPQGAMSIGVWMGVRLRTDKTQAGYPPEKSFGEKLRSSTFHSPYLSDGNIV